MEVPEPEQPFSSVDAGAKLLELLRWVLVVPVALISATLVNMLFNLGNSPGCTRGMVDPESDVIDAIWVTLAGGGVTGYAVVVAGAWAAPRFRQTAGVVVGVGYIFLLGGLFFLALAVDGFTLGGGVGALARVVGVALGVQGLMSSRPAHA